MSEASSSARLSGLELLHAMIAGTLPPPPAALSCHMRLAEAEKGRAVFTGDVDGSFLNPLGSVHGGWIATLLDSAMACAVHSTLGPGQSYTTVEMKVNYVRALAATAGTVRCEGRVIHAGSRIATSEGRLVDAEGRLIAHGTETCLIFAPRAP